MIWVSGILISIITGTFIAGLKRKALFYRHGKVDFDLCWFYCVKLVLGGLTWPISLPLFLIYNLGKYFSKEV